MIDLKDPYMRNHAEETLIGCDIKGPAQSKNKNVYFLAPAQTKGMQPILVACEATFKSK